MRLDPADVLLRLEPGAHMINVKTGQVQQRGLVELNWKDGRKWVRRSFVTGEDAPTLGAVLAKLGEYLDSHESLEAFLEAMAGR